MTGFRLARCIADGELHELIRHLDSGAVDLSKPTQLCRTMTEAGSDKGSDHHNYTIIYDLLFSAGQLNVTRLLEVGIGTNYTDIPSNMGPEGRPGASLRGWRTFFPNADIFGADIDKRVLFSEPRIQTFFVDQLSPAAISEMWNAIGVSDFDVIIDDGLHEFEANRIFFENSIRHLKHGGLFIIEDILCEKRNIEAFDTFLRATGYEFALLVLPHGKNRADNALAIIRKSKLGGGKDIAFGEGFYSGIETLQAPFRRKEAQQARKAMIRRFIPKAVLSLLRRWRDRWRPS
jgi:SAM-dependent methyltransferase